MFRKYYCYILLFLGVSLLTTLYATNYSEQDEGKNDTEDTFPEQKILPKYYNYTQQYSNKKIDNSIDLEELKDEEDDFKDNNSINSIKRRLKSKEDAIFFILITSNTHTKKLSKFFFINKDPHIEKDVVWKTQKSFGCHVISHTNPKSSPHVIFQVLGWLEQENNKYTPVFMHSSSPICITCNSIISSFFQLNMLYDAKGCNEFDSLDFENTCSLSEQYIKRKLTLSLAKKILLPSIHLKYEGKIRLLESSRNFLMKKVKLNATRLGLKEDLQKERDVLQHKYDELEKEAQRRQQNLLLEKEDLQRQLGKSKQANNKQQNTIGSLKKEKINSEDKLNNKLQILEGKNGKLSDEIQIAQQKINHMLLENKRLQKECDNFKKSIQFKEQNNNALNKDITLLKKENQKIQQSSSLANEQATKLLLEKEKLQRQLDNSKQANNKQQSSIKSLKEKKVDLENKLNVLKHTNSDLNKDVTLFKKQKNNWKQKKRTLQKRYNGERKWLKNVIKHHKVKIELPYSPLKGHTSTVWSVAVTSDNQYIVSGSDDKTIRIWHFNSGKEVHYSPLKGDTSIVYGVAVTSDNKYIVSGSWDNTIRIWHFKTGKEVSYSPLKGHTNCVQSVAVTGDNKYIVSCSYDKTIRIWDFKTGKEVKYSPLTGHTESVWSVAITADNKYIVSGSLDKTIRIWDLNTGKEVKYSPLKGHNSYVCSVAMTKDNKYIVSGSLDKTIRIWDLNTGKEVKYSPLKGHTSYVRSVAITADNKYIVSGSEDNTIRIWDLNTGKEVHYSPLKGHTWSVCSVAVTADNQYIVSGSLDKTIRIWDWKLLRYLNSDDQKEEEEVFDID